MPTLPDPSAAIPAPLNTVYLLVADNVWAKLYSTAIPFAELTLVSHRVNFVGRVSSVQAPGPSSGLPSAQGNEDFIRSLVRTLKSDYQAGRFDTLVMIAPGDFVVTVLKHLDGGFHGRVLEETMQAPGQLTQEELLVHLHAMLADAAVQEHFPRV